MCIKIWKLKVKIYVMILLFVLTAFRHLITNIDTQLSNDTSNAISVNKLSKVSSTCVKKMVKPSCVLNHAHNHRVANIHKDKRRIKFSNARRLCNFAQFFSRQIYDLDCLLTGKGIEVAGL